MPIVKVLSSTVSIEMLMAEISTSSNKNDGENNNYSDYSVWIACTILSSILADSKERKQKAMSIFFEDGIYIKFLMKYIYQSVSLSNKFPSLKHLYSISP